MPLKTLFVQGLFAIAILFSLTNHPVTGAQEKVAAAQVETQSPCRLYYFTKRQLEQARALKQDIQSLSSGINQALKTSFEFANKIDHYTLGLVSALVAPSGQSLEAIKPVEWDKMTIGGRLIYQDSPLNATPLRGVRIIFSEAENKVEVQTGLEGEFSQAFHQLVPYKRLRLFPMPVLEWSEKYVRSAKIPLLVRVETKLCTAETKLTEIPFEPLVLVVSTND